VRTDISQVKSVCRGADSTISDLIENSVANGGTNGGFSITVRDVDLFLSVICVIFVNEQMKSKYEPIFEPSLIFS